MSHSYKFYKNSGKTSYALRGTIKPGCLLFAEGDSEALFLEKWLETINCDPNDIAVICIQGINKLEVSLKKLSGEENFANVKRYGFLIDAENGAAKNKENMVTELLRKYSVIPKKHHIRAGQLSEIENKRIALFVSPNNNSKGCIEDIVINEISDDILFPCIKAFTQCVESTTGESISPKSLVQVYISTYKPRLCGTGRGFESGVLKVTHDAYADIKNTLNTLISSA